MARPGRGWRFSKGKVIVRFLFAPCSDQKSMCVLGRVKGVRFQALIVRGVHSCSVLVLGLSRGGDSSKIRSREKSVSRSVSNPDSRNHMCLSDSSRLVASTMLTLGIFLLVQRCWMMARVIISRSVSV
jgi:hypothetical protein